MGSTGTPEVLADGKIEVELDSVSFHHEGLKGRNDSAIPDGFAIELSARSSRHDG